MDILRADEWKRRGQTNQFPSKSHHDKHYFEISPLTWGMKPHIGGNRSPRRGGNSGIYFCRRNCWADSSDIAIPSPPAVISAEGDDGKKTRLVAIISMTFGIIDAKVSDFFIYLHPENSFRRQYETYI